MSAVTTTNSAQAPSGREHPLDRSRQPVLIVNTRSRSGASAYAEARRKIADAGIELAATYPLAEAQRLSDVVRDEIAQGRRTVIIGGGDGTISSVVDHFAHNGVILGILPLGTANSFARTIGLPLDLDGAIEVLLDGRIADVDLGIINGDYFANTASIGLPPAIAESVPHRLKRWLGRLAYALAGMDSLARHSPFRCTVSIDGRQRVYSTLDLTVALGSYQGGLLVAEETKVDDGEFVLHVLASTSKTLFLAKWLGHMLGIELARDQVDVLRGREAVIDTNPKQAVSIDGEVVAETPLRISVARRALRLIVPPEIPSAHRFSGESA